MNLMVLEGSTTTIGRIIAAFLEGLTGLVSGVAGSVVDVFDTVFITSTGDLTTLAYVGILGTAAGIVLALVRKFSAKRAI